MKNFLFAFIAVLFFSAAWADDSTVKAMIHDLEVAKYQYETKYAPKAWKKERYGWSLEESFLTAKRRIETERPQTIKEYQKIFRDFIFSTNDYHVNVRFYSTGISWFPMKIRGFQNRYYIANDLSPTPQKVRLFNTEEIDWEAYDETLEKLIPGSEILAIDGKPVAQAIEEIIDDKLGGDRTPTGFSLAELMIFTRAESEAETFTITVKNDDEVEVLTLPWVRVPEWIKEQPLKAADPEFLEASFNLTKGKKNPKKAMEAIGKLLRKDYSIKNVQPLLFQKFDAEETQKDRREKGFLPELGDLLWETDKDQELYAYLYKNKKGRKIGYIYLESFDPFDAEAMVEELIEAIAFLEKESDALVFDISNNPGGDPFYLYAVLSTLTDKPLACPTQRETLIQEDLYDYILLQQLVEWLVKWGAEEEEGVSPNLSGFVIDETVIQEIQQYTRSLLKNWESGKRLSEPLYLYGIPEIRPHPKAHYTKPILVLINELDFSCADIFPAILQDNQRAVLFGKKTAGAGGYVRPYQHTSRFGIASYSITGSILTRTNGEVLENLGVSPDIPYEISLRDIQENYADYIQKVNKEINKLI